MGQTQKGRGFRRSLRRTRYRRGRRGVVSVVGTLLALLVFFALFGVFLTQYLPLWMTENESQLTSQSESSLASVKAGIDTQLAFGGPSTYTVPFTMSSQGVPLLAQPTSATLSLLPSYCPAQFVTSTGVPNQPQNCVFQRVSMIPSGSLARNDSYLAYAASGSVELQIPNRYYSAQTFYLEDDALIQFQPGGREVMLLPPPLALSKVGTNTTVRDTFLQVFTNSSEFVGQGTEDMTSTLLSSIPPVTSAGRFVASNGSAVPFTFSFTVGTLNLCGWYGFLSNLKNTSAGALQSGGSITLTVLNGSSSIAPPFSTGVCNNGGRTTYDLTVAVTKVTFASVDAATVQLGLNVGGL
jgi:hypothetical protein